MQIKTHIQKIILTVALAGILLGCGGDSKEGGTDQNQSSGDKGNSKSGGNEVALTEANQVKSVNNAGSIRKSLVRYMQRSKDRKFPLADTWCDDIKREAQTQLIFLSPQLPQTKELWDKVKKATNEDQWIQVSHYALNSRLSGKDEFELMGEVHIGLLVSIFECDLGWNGSGGLEDALKYMDKYKLEKIAVSLGSGSSRSVTQEELKKLEW